MRNYTVFVFEDWLISFGTMSSEGTHVAPCVTAYFVLKDEYYSIISVYTFGLSIQLSVDYSTF
jgi:hypothetical protein